jgi:hypothetical protein
MNIQEGLQALAAQDATASTCSYEEFEQRQARTAARRHAVTWGAAVSVAALGLVVAIAVSTQDIQRFAAADTLPVTVVADTPALVDLDQFEVTSDLEDHIAMLDAQLSMARAYSIPSAQLQQLESTREQLNGSLQRVSHAHSLLSL